MPSPAPSQPQDSRPSAFRAGRVYATLAGFLALTSVTTYLLYTNTQALFRWSLDERLAAVAAVAATKFDPRALDAITGPESVGTDAHRSTVLELARIRTHTRNLKYAYILRRTDDPNTLAFVADADSLHPDTPVDLNGDGVIGDEDALTRPGDPYDVSGFPEFRRDAFTKPFVDPALVHDQWGTFVSGTAPIGGSGATRPARYVIGFDLDVSEFERLTNLALVPFALFVGFLLLALTALTVILTRMWRAQVHLLADVDRQKDELLGIIAHQLATPVTAVTWSADSLLAGDSGPLTPPQHADVQTIRAVAGQLSDLVTMILDVSRIQLGKVPIAPAPLDLGDLLREILEVIRIKARETGVRLTESVPAALPVALLDKRYTRMALENLLSNAVKYTHVGGTVTFTVERREGVLRCTLADTGCGIPAGEQAKIFGKLFRASNVRNAREGNGFGLYVAKGAVEAQGGRIRFESVEGRGTTFVVELPLKYPPQ